MTYDGFKRTITKDGNMNNYFRIKLGYKNIHIQDCLDGNFVGVDFNIPYDLTGKFPDDWHDFNKEFIPIYLANNPERTKVLAGLACGNLWTVAKYINIGDFVLCQDQEEHFHVGEVTGNYIYQPGSILPHRRQVKWLTQTIAREDLSQAFRQSAGAASFVCNLTNYRDEIERLIGGSITQPPIVSTDETIEDPYAFAMEKHLEDFLLQNWEYTELGKNYNIFEEEGERVGQQYQTDTGPIDILAISKDKKTLLVLELKKGHASDAVVGQALRYMGYVKEELADVGQSVKGIIIAIEDDPRIRRALIMVPDIDFYQYKVSFKLIKGVK
jgi:restriction system protein